MAFSQKAITVQFDLANGQFQGGGNTATISGARVSAHIENLGGADQSNCELAIYGLPLQLMNQLSNVGAQYNKDYPNGVSVLAGEEGSALSLVFEGQILTAFVDAQSMPQVCFRVIAKPGVFHYVQPIAPTSIQGSADVAGIASNLAKQMGFSFENNGVNIKLANPYFPGTAWAQMVALADHAGIEWIVDKGTLAITKPGTARQGGAILISPVSGMAGYPAFNQQEVIVKAQFDPRVKFNGTVQIQSDLTAANGTFIVKKLEYDLESQMPHGKWFMIIHAYVQGATTP